MQKLSPNNLQTIESIFESLGLGILLVDTQGTITFSNPAASTMIGIGKEVVPLENWTEYYGFYLPDGTTLYPETESPLRRAITGEEVINLEVLIQNHLGTGRANSCAIDLKPWKNTKGEITGALLVIKDNSEQKKLSEEAARSNMALQQFATVAAHDLQEPLRSISGFTDMLLQYQAGQLEEKSLRCMTKIKDGVIRMQTLINDLLAYSRIQTKPQVVTPTDCNEILGTCIKSLNASIAESGAQINVDSLPVIMADASQLTQLFQNLIGNAIKFCATERPIIVSIRAKREATSWLFSVEDNGIGIAPEFSERVFRIFQRLHTATAYSGTGIGLAICETIVGRHGGRIWVESEPGNGSTFYFTIPDSGEEKT